MALIDDCRPCADAARLWCRPHSQEAIVSCNNERLNSNEGVAGAINAFCGPAVRRFLDAECGADGCRTGDALRSPTFGLLPSAHIVHTIAPRYTAQYHDAAVYALHRCGCGWVCGWVYCTPRISSYSSACF